MQVAVDLGPVLPVHGHAGHGSKMSSMPPQKGCIVGVATGEVIVWTMLSLAARSPGLSS